MDIIINSDFNRLYSFYLEILVDSWMGHVYVKSKISVSDFKNG